MRLPTLALALAVLTVVAATGAFTSGFRAPSSPDEPAPQGASFEDVTITSFDGTLLKATAFRPAGASSSQPVPVVLHSHGWSGSRASAPEGIVARLAEEGFGVVSIDARGHGESGGYASVHHRDFEVKDFQTTLDWIHDNLDWVQKETDSGIPKDVVAGGAGYSYGGGFQLMLASYDARLDALTPEITWSDLPDALAPQGVVKSTWVHFLYGTAKESGTRIDPRIDHWYRTAMVENRFPQEAHDHFVNSSPVLGNIQADVLLIQGVPDVLFNLNQAVRAYDALEAAGAGDVRLFTHLTGHVLPTQPLGLSETRRMPFEDEGPCGRVSDIVIAWLDAKLRDGAATSIPEVSFALDTGECVRLDAYPRDVLSVHAATPAAATSGAGSLLFPLMEGPAVVAGIPRLSAQVDSLASPTRAFASLVVVSDDGRVRSVDDQAQPLALAPGKAIDLDLVGVATRLSEGDQLLLRLDGLNEWYLTNSARLPGLAPLRDVVVQVPIVPGA